MCGVAGNVLVNGIVNHTEVASRVTHKTAVTYVVINVEVNTTVPNTRQLSAIPVLLRVRRNFRPRQSTRTTDARVANT